MANKITKKDNFKAIMEVLENTGRNDWICLGLYALRNIFKRSRNF